jgi:two-component system cell cycle response regulator
MVVLEAKTGEAAIQIAGENAATIDAVLLDVMMPGMDGWDTLARLRENEATAVLPVIMLTAHANAEGDLVRGAESGAVDHVAKPFSGRVLAAKVKALCTRSRRERDLRRKLHAAEDRATIDPLTGLGNRRHLETRLKAEVAHARRHKVPLSLVILDLDHFKSVNDTYGHEAGDRVLSQFADTMRAVFRADDFGFRYGGEEFVVLLRATPSARAVQAAERLRVELRARKFEVGAPHEPLQMTVSAGVASADESNEFNASDLISRADAALYRAKREGRDRIEASESDEAPSGSSGAPSTP